MELKLKNQLQNYLAKREMTAALLARKAGIPKQSLSGWLAGSNPRDVRQVKRVAEVLGVSLDHLMFGVVESEDSPKAADLETLLGNGWITGLFEVKFRRVKK
jgi:transcriptional regulator with XRE-family HTH domain